jgi:hypothetical protein
LPGSRIGLLRDAFPSHFFFFWKRGKWIDRQLGGGGTHRLKRIEVAHHQLIWNLNHQKKRFVMAVFPSPTLEKCGRAVYKHEGSIYIWCHLVFIDTPSYFPIFLSFDARGVETCVIYSICRRRGYIELAYNCLQPPYWGPDLGFLTPGHHPP